MAEKAPVEVSTRDLHFASLVKQLEGNPKYRPIVHAMVAEAFPEAAAGEFADVEARKAIAPLAKKLEEDRAAFAKEREDAKKDSEYKEWRASLVSAGIPAAELDTVEKTARDRGVRDPQMLAQWWQSTQKVAQPTSRGFGVGIPGRNKAGGEWFESDGQGGPGIMGDRQSWTLNRAAQVFEEEMARTA